MPQFVDTDAVDWSGRRVPLLRCECMTRIDWEDLERGYCDNCQRALEVVAGPNPVA